MSGLCSRVVTVVRASLPTPFHTVGQLPFLPPFPGEYPAHSTWHPLINCIMYFWGVWCVSPTAM